MPNQQFRFRGQTPPTPGMRTPLLNRVNTSAPDETGEVTIRLYDPIDSWGGDWGVSAVEFAEALDQIPNAPAIALHINSPGGEVFEAIAILNLIRQHPANVTAYVDGIAASAASFIAAGCDQLVMAQNATLMVHDAWGICIGNTADMTQTANLLDKLSNNVASIYAAKSGAPVAEWRDVMLAETWLSADEAVVAGLADSVASDTEKDPAAQAKFDLSAFKYKNRDNSPAPLIPAARAQSACKCGPRGLSAPHDWDHKDECPTKSRTLSYDLKVKDDGTTDLVERISAEMRRRHHANRLALTAARFGLEHTDPKPKAEANDAQDAAMLTQALGWFTAVDNIVDEAQEALAAYLGIPNPDADDAPDEGDSAA